MALGFWLLHRTRLIDSDRIPQIASLLTDPRWPWQPTLVRPMPSPGEGVYPWPSGKIAAKALARSIEGVLRSDAATAIHLTVSRQDHENHAFTIVDNGSPRALHEGTYPYRAVGSCRYPVPAGANIDEWLALVRELASLLDVGNGVIWIDTDERLLVGRMFVSGSARPTQPPDHPANEAHRINRGREHLGERYVRFPGWATFLRRAHVEAIGGREKLVAAVNPPVIHDIGDLLYVQLSPSVDDALAPETSARRRAFIDLLAPIIVPMP